MVRARLLSTNSRNVGLKTSALQLGFMRPPPEVAESKDVDGIIPLGDLDAFAADEHFWDAQEATNDALRPRGLYITHLFLADQVFSAATGRNAFCPSPGRRCAGSSCSAGNARSVRSLFPPRHPRHFGRDTARCSTPQIRLTFDRALPTTILIVIRAAPAYSTPRILLPASVEKLH